MKKIFVILISLIILCTLLTSCGNQAILDPGNFSFKHVHITDPIEGHCFDIEKWWDNENGVEVRLSNGEGIFSLKVHISFLNLKRLVLIVGTNE